MTKRYCCGIAYQGSVCNQFQHGRCAEAENVSLKEALFEWLSKSNTKGGNPHIFHFYSRCVHSLKEYPSE